MEYYGEASQKHRSAMGQVGIIREKGHVKGGNYSEDNWRASQQYL